MASRRLIITFVTGGVVGWCAKEQKTKFYDNIRTGESAQASVQRALASWNPNYQPVAWDSNWDRRDPTLTKIVKKHGNDGNSENSVDGESKKIAVPTATRHLLLIRHGQYNLNGKEETDRSLTELGREHAELTGRRLAELSFPYTRIVQSSLTRAQETAGIIHKFLPDLKIVQTDLLKEGAPFPPEPPLHNWKDEFKYYEEGSRIEAAFRQFFHRADVKQQKDSYEIIVCHANVIRYMVCRALQIPPEAWLRMSLHHGSITWITIRPSGRVSIRMLGDCGHMPPQKLTTS